MEIIYRLVFTLDSLPKRVSKIIYSGFIVSFIIIFILLMVIGYDSIILSYKNEKIELLERCLKEKDKLLDKAIDSKMQPVLNFDDAKYRYKYEGSR